jgi:hypothetical protein
MPLLPKVTIATCLMPLLPKVTIATCLMPLLKIIQLYCNDPLIDGGNSSRQKNIHFLKNSPTLFLIILKFLICHIFIYSASALNTFSPFFFF